MERLTNKSWRNFDPWECCGQDQYCQRGCHDPGGCTKGCIVPRLYKRLAAYEDTELTTEEIDMDHEAAETLRQLCRGCDLDRLEKLAEADKDGRLLVPPCKVDDVLYRASPSGVVVHRVANVMYRGLTSRWYIDTIPNLPYASEELGKTTFLTSEEAEKALEAMKDG